jgi:hypothetical protein
MIVTLRRRKTPFHLELVDSMLRRVCRDVCHFVVVSGLFKNAIFWVLSQSDISTEHTATIFRVEEKAMQGTSIRRSQGFVILNVFL